MKLLLIFFHQKSIEENDYEILKKFSIYLTIIFFVGILILKNHLREYFSQPLFLKKLSNRITPLRNVQNFNQQNQSQEIQSKSNFEDDQNSSVCLFIKRKTSTNFLSVKKSDIISVLKRSNSNNLSPRKIKKRKRDNGSVCVNVEINTQSKLFKSDIMNNEVKINQSIDDECPEKNFNFPYRKTSSLEIPIEKFKKISEGKFSIEKKEIFSLKKSESLNKGRISEILDSVQELKNKDFSLSYSEENEEEMQVSPLESPNRYKQQDNFRKSLERIRFDSFLLEEKLDEKIENDQNLTPIKKCYTCEENLGDCIFMPCKHGGICLDCVKTMLEHNKEHCPLCRKVTFF